MVMRHAKVCLPAGEREQLEQTLRSGSSLAREQARARVLLLTDHANGHHTDEQVAASVMLSSQTVIRIRQRYVQGGLEHALHDRPRPGVPPRITGDVEAKLTTLACSDPPDGRCRWTLRLLADKMVELGYIDQISYVTVQDRLKKTHSSPGGPRVGASLRRRAAS